MRHNENPNLDVYAIDYSAKAIEVVKVCRSSRPYVILGRARLRELTGLNFEWLRRRTPCIHVLLMERGDYMPLYGI